ncbi:MAG: Ig domain-containing protein [Candidatus Berkelbacteria bacterium]|nr:Ig domain-containing protein [Candidatus Berkelbacteria bacterium]MCR4306964.1 Ig domain-containing protein [Candidatus Berkelbacteria bacterium]
MKITNSLACYAIGMFMVVGLLLLASMVGCGGAGATNELTITTSSFPSGNEGRHYSQFLRATGGKLPYRWSIAKGLLPNGLSLNSETGEISGVPNQFRYYEFTAQVNDGAGRLKTRDLSIGIGVEMEVTAEVTLVTSDWPTTADYDVVLKIDDASNTVRLSTSSQPVGVNLTVVKRADQNQVILITVTIVPPANVNNGTPVERILYITQSYELRNAIEKDVTLDIWPSRPNTFLTKVHYKLSGVNIP